VIDAQSLPVLQDIVRRESRSLLQYIHDSFPWTSAGEESALAQVRQCAEEERESAAGLVRWLARRRQIVPNLGSYPAGFTTINYASLDFILPKLAAEERKGLAKLTEDLALIADSDAHALVSALIEKKRQHLKTLEELIAAHPEPPMIRRGA
jgi:rubrerythrin